MKRIGWTLQGIGASLLGALVLAVGYAAWAWTYQPALGLLVGSAAAAAGVYGAPLAVVLVVAGWIMTKVAPAEDLSRD